MPKKMGGQQGREQGLCSTLKWTNLIRPLQQHFEMAGQDQILEQTELSSRSKFQSKRAFDLSFEVTEPSFASWAGEPKPESDSFMHGTYYIQYKVFG